MRSTILLAATVGLGVAGCGDAKTATPGLPPGEGMLPVPGGRIWYKQSGREGKLPLILVHGGPGFSSYYLKSLEALGTDRPVIRYDQLGGGKSDPLTDTTQFTIAHFVRELDSLRAALGYDRIHVLGHSWGTIVAYEYYRAHPERVAGIVFGSPVFDLPAYQRRARSLVATLSDSAQEAIRLGEAARSYDGPGYQNALGEFYGRYLWRHPVEADLDSLFRTYNQAIYNYMQGPSEFTITGTLRSYDVTAGLGAIRVPVLYTVGEFDEVGPELVKRFAERTPGAAYALIPGAAHITTWDNPEVMLQVVRQFLARADSARPGG